MSHRKESETEPESHECFVPEHEPEPGSHQNDTPPQTMTEHLQIGGEFCMVQYSTLRLGFIIKNSLV
jgi:hypothetical protein